VFVGRGPASEFPVPHGQAPETFVTQVTAPTDFPLAWHALIANGCDLDHLQTVHLRRLKEPPEVGRVSPQAFRVRYRTAVIGRRPADWLMRWLSGDDHEYNVTPKGEESLSELGVDIDEMRARRRRFAFGCLDWSERRPHLGGAVGAALMQAALKRRWVQPDLDSRALRLTAAGKREMAARFGLSIEA